MALRTRGEGEQGRGLMHGRSRELSQAVVTEKELQLSLFKLGGVVDGLGDHGECLVHILTSDGSLQVGSNAEQGVEQLPHSEVDVAL
jgi:hypothetical protein